MGRGQTFPIGISQLSQAYAGVPQMTAGSDHYLGELTVENVPGPLRHERFMAAVHDADQPLTSLEFEAGTGDYGEDLSRLTSPETDRAQDPALRGPGQPADQLLPVRRRPQPAARRAGRRRQRPDRVHRRATRLRGADRPGGPAQHRRFPAAGQRGAGGPRRRAPAGRHGRGARRRRARLRARPLPDRVRATRRRPPPRAWSATSSGSAAWVRATSWPGRCCSAATPSARSTCPARRRRTAPTWTRPVRRSRWPRPPVLGRATQERLAAFVEAGGRLLLHGVLPVLDDDGTDCTVLADALGLAAGTRVEGTPHHFPSVRATGVGGRPARGAGRRPAAPGGDRLDAGRAARASTSPTGRP